jgi:ribokinase
MAAAGVVICQLEIPVEVTAAALRTARAEGTVAILNPAPARDDLSGELLADCDVLCPNQSEAGLMTGRRVETVEQAIDAASDLLDRGPRAVVVTLGADGCVVADRFGVDHVLGVRVEAVDSTGAGDAFVGALGYYLARGDDLREAVGWANRIAALSVCKPGTQTSYPDRAELPPEVLASLEN